MKKLQFTTFLLLLFLLAGTQLSAADLDANLIARAESSEAYDKWLSNNPNFSKPSDSTLRQSLNPIQYKVTQHEGTERPFSNEYWNNKEDGIYVDIVSGEPLFSSADKYKSGTGWPSFTRTISKQAMTIEDDFALFSRRSELRSARADSHLGHLFSDGPRPTKQRYCINSAALRFIKKEDLAAQGYSEFIALFD